MDIIPIIEKVINEISLLEIKRLRPQRKWLID